MPARPEAGQRANSRGGAGCPPAPKVLVPGDLPPSLLTAEPPPEERAIPAGTTLRNAERDLILRTLERSGGNRSRAAETLGISARTLRNKLKEYRETGLLEEAGQAV